MNPLSSACVVGGKNASKRILFPLSLSTFIYLSWGKCMPQLTSGGQRTGCGNRSSHSTMWATGFELRLSVLAASAFTHGAISPALGLIFFFFICSSVLSLCPRQTTVSYLKFFSVRLMPLLLLQGRHCHASFDTQES